MASRNESPFFFFDGGSSLLLSSPAGSASRSVDDVDNVPMMLLHLDGWVVDEGCRKEVAGWIAECMIATRNSK